MIGGIDMEIKERKLRNVGNSVVISISKDFLDANDLEAGDIVLLDEEKLKEAIVKKADHTSKIDLLINQSIAEYDQAYKDLVDL